MSPNMSTLNRTVRTVVRAAGDERISLWPLYALVRFDSRGRRPLPH